MLNCLCDEEPSVAALGESGGLDIILIVGSTHSGVRSRARVPVVIFLTMSPKNSPHFRLQCMSTLVQKMSRLFSASLMTLVVCFVRRLSEGYRKRPSDGSPNFE